MILTILAYTGNRPPRIFYGLKENGRPFFNNGTTPYHSMNGMGEKFESETIVIKMNQNEQEEFLLSVGKGDSYLEIFDFKNNKTYYKYLKYFVDDTVTSFRNTLISLIPKGDANYYLFGFTIKDENDYKYLFEIQEIQSFQDSEIQ